MEMPPMLNWFVGPGNYGVFMEWVFEAAGTDWRLESVAANGQPGFAAYRRAGGGYELHTLQIFTITTEGISRNSVFQDSDVFASFVNWRPDSLKSLRGRDRGPNARPSRRSERRGFHRAADLGGGALSSRQLPRPDCVGQVGHPLRRLRADLLQGYSARVHALEQADPGAEQHGSTRDRKLVDQAGVHVLQDRRAAARDADVTVAGGIAGLVERGLDAVVDEVEGGPAGPLPRVTLLVRHDEDRRVERRLLRPRLLARVVVVNPACPSPRQVPHR